MPGCTKCGGVYQTGLKKCPHCEDGKRKIVRIERKAKQDFLKSIKTEMDLIDAEGRIIKAGLPAKKYLKNEDGSNMTFRQFFNEGRKDDAGKLRWHLLPFDQLEPVVRVLMFGEKKYGAFNWQKVPEAKDRYFDATMRHIRAWQKGERQDTDTGENPLAHAICDLIFLLWLEMQDKPEAQS